MDYKYLVKKLRTKLIMTQTELAEILGVSFASINRWETGKTKPSKKANISFRIFCEENNIDIEEVK